MKPIKMPSLTVSVIVKIFPTLNFFDACFSLLAFEIAKGEWLIAV